MAVEVAEKFESRRISTGTQPSANFHYWVMGTNDEVEARAALADAAPTSYDPWGTGLLALPRNRIEIEPKGDKLWDGHVQYGATPQTNESSFQFDTGGGTQHITQSKETVASEAKPPRNPPNAQRGIGATADGVEGVDVVVPVYHFSETHVLPDSIVTSAYKADLFALTGRVNDAPFKGCAAGECLFMGAAGSKRGNGDWEIAFRFAASPNVASLSVCPDIPPVAKGGWEYLWVRYEPVKSEDVLIQNPVAVYVERVYDYGNFSLLGIGT